MLLIQILLIALLFTLVVGVHELGHFLFAKWRKMDVEEFSIGFGPKLYSRAAKSGTAFSLRGIPVGGFVRIKGMEPKPDASETKVPGGFYSGSLGSRAAVLFAGPLFSVIGGFMFFLIAYGIYGEPKATNDPTIGDVLPKTRADKAGLKRGDIVLSANNIGISKFSEFRKAISTSPEKSVQLRVKRGDSVLTLSVTPELNKEAAVFDESGEPKKDSSGKIITAAQGTIGILPPSQFIRVSLPLAAADAAKHTWLIISETGRVLATPSELKENAGGVISIATATSRAAEEGVQRFINLAAIISISLGLINLLPIPLMDGGQLVVTFIEALRGGRRLSLKTQEAIGFVGLVIIGLLFLSVTYLDIGRLLGN